MVALPFDLPITSFGMSGGPPFQHCALGMLPPFLCVFGSSRAWALSVSVWIALSCLSGWLGFHQAEFSVFPWVLPGLFLFCCGWLPLDVPPLSGLGAPLLCCILSAWVRVFWYPVWVSIVCLTIFCWVCMLALSHLV